MTKAKIEAALTEALVALALLAALAIAWAA
jgi:hypothetical protein